MRILTDEPTTVPAASRPLTESENVNSHPIPALTDRIESVVDSAIRSACPQVERPDPLVRRSDHADFQSNAALPLAKIVGKPPRALAEDIVSGLGDGLIEKADIAGPGFVNLTISNPSLWRQVTARLAGDELALDVPETGRVTVIDYSAPNVAKQMHVGHLRTTIIGDTLARMYTALGGTVVAQNHLGDWGTQFGMLIQYLDEHPEADWHATGDDPTGGIVALDELYRAARAEFDRDPGFAERARARVVALQSGDEATLSVWRELVAVSTTAFNEIYSRLSVRLTDDDLAGESTYNHLLDDVTAELVDAGVAVESDGALCVFFDEFTGPEGDPVPLIIRKSDGGYGYAATDLATIRHRVRDLKADRVLYVVDARQSLHFQMVFATARRAGWLTDDVEVVHTAFGTVLGKDGRPFKTRSGGTIPLTELLDSAVAAAGSVVAEKNPGLAENELDRIAASAGIAAVKYADLSTARTTDYRFDVDKMVALTGNTGVYLQYAHTRIASILRKAGDVDRDVDPDVPPHAAERALALHLDAYERALVEAARLYEPHRLCSYLYTLAKTFTAFYEACPIIAADTAAERGNRLALAELTRRTLAHGLDLLGIDAPEQM